MFYIILIIDIYIYMYIHSITIDEQPIFLSVWGAQIFILSSSNHHPDTLSLVSDIPSGSIYGIYIIYSVWHFSGILSVICYDILSGSLSGIYIIWNYMFGSRRGPLHPELAIWFGAIHAHSQSWQRRKPRGEGGGERGRRRSCTFFKI